MITQRIKNYLGVKAIVNDLSLTLMSCQTDRYSAPLTTRNAVRLTFLKNTGKFLMTSRTIDVKSLTSVAPNSETKMCWPFVNTLRKLVSFGT